MIRGRRGTCMKLDIEEIIIFALSFFLASIITAPIEKKIGIAGYNMFEDGFDARFIIGLVLFVVIALLLKASIEKIWTAIKNRRKQ